MSSNITSPSDSKTTPNPTASPQDKGKSKAHTDVAMEEEEEEEEEEAASEEEEEDDAAVCIYVDETFDEIDPAAILPTGRRTRGVKVDYTSKEALAKAGLKETDKDDDSDDDVEMKE
ncbi:hypothetical protein BD779DRAFT_1059022 [Infundibulicybe gibba]|nr:hypothetical protein BD779DRAFT_1059022 [Infundibulicybe gibba]